LHEDPELDLGVDALTPRADTDGVKMANQAKFVIPKQTDTAVIKALQDIALSREDKVKSWHLGTPLSGQITLPAAGVATDPRCATILELESSEFSSIRCTMQSGAYVGVQRDSAKTEDHVTVVVPPNSDAIDGSLLLNSARTRLQSFDLPGRHIEMLGAEVSAHYRAREAELSKLTSIVESALGKVSTEAAQLRGQLEQEFSERGQRQQAELAKEREALAAREAELTTRIASVDNSDSRHARRALRKALKTKLAEHDATFELTQGTRRLRWPVFAILFLMLAATGTGFAAYTVQSLQMLSAGGAETAALVAVAVRQLFLGAGFGGTAIYFVRWANHWLQRHAAEELRLKRLNLDFDRASWLVEMALEWHAETGTEIPATLLNRISADLFPGEVSGAGQREPTHPAQDFLDRLLGAASEMTVELPNGVNLKLPKRQVKKLMQPSQASPAE
jgi:hypothetical protein